MKPSIKHTQACILIMLSCLSVSGQELRLGIGIERNILPKLEIEGEAQLRKLYKINKSNADVVIRRIGRQDKWIA